MKERDLIHDAISRLDLHFATMERTATWYASPGHVGPNADRNRKEAATDLQLVAAWVQIRTRITAK